MGLLPPDTQRRHYVFAYVYVYIYIYVPVNSLPDVEINGFIINWSPVSLGRLFTGQLVSRFTGQAVHWSLDLGLWYMACSSQVKLLMPRAARGLTSPHHMHTPRKKYYVLDLLTTLFQPMGHLTSSSRLVAVPAVIRSASDNTQGIHSRRGLPTLRMYLVVVGAVVFPMNETFRSTVSGDERKTLPRWTS